MIIAANVGKILPQILEILLYFFCEHVKTRFNRVFYFFA